MKEWNSVLFKFERGKTSKQFRTRSLGIQKDKKKTRGERDGVNMRTEKL